ERKGDQLELTPRAIRKIGQKALKDIFQHLAKDRFGNHEADHRGRGGDRSDDTKAYEFGDPFLLDLRSTLQNAMVRQGAGTPERPQAPAAAAHRAALERTGDRHQPAGSPKARSQAPGATHGRHPPDPGDHGRRAYSVRGTGSLNAGLFLPPDAQDAPANAAGS